MLKESNRKPFFPVGRKDLKLNLVGLGDVGGTLLTGLMLAGTMFSEVGIYDPDENRCKRYEQEMNQILPIAERKPRVYIRTFEELFDCDAFAFTASVSVPPVGSGIQDVRMAQYEKNQRILRPYAQEAVRSGFSGLFFQISDPVDLLCSTIQETGFDPGRIIGCGLGVMRARADYCARKHRVTNFLSQGRVFGPHGKDLIVANATGEAYDDALSRELTGEVVAANLAVRETGYKPYIAPGLSSGLSTIVNAVEGAWFDGAVQSDDLFYGWRARLTTSGIERESLSLHPLLVQRIQASMEAQRVCLRK